MAEISDAPKLSSNTSGNLSGYSPISWTAVASLGVSGLFGLILVGGLLLQGRTFIMPTLLILPAVAVVLAFVARRQIKNSEGTRTGEQYANWGWYVGIITGLIYLTYLFAIEFTVRNDAERELSAFIEPLLKLDPANAQDPNLYSAMYQLIPPGQRNTLSSKTDAAGMEASYKDMILAFRSTDLYQLCARNPGDVKFRPTGMVSWEQARTEINCVIRGVLTSPEGECEAHIPLIASIDAGKRRWMVVSKREGFIVPGSYKLTDYGWAIKMLEFSGRANSQEMMMNLARPNGSNTALLGYVMPGWNVEKALKFTELWAKSIDGRMALAGPMGSSFALPPESQNMIPDKLFAHANGKPLAEADKITFRNAWLYPQRITPPGSTLRNNSDTATLLRLGQTIELSQAAELILAQEGQNPPTARAKILMEIPSSDSAAILARLSALRAEGATAKKSADLPDFIKNEFFTNKWRVTKIVSDLKQVPVSRDPAGAGPGGMPG
jgi:hypothetical protein